MPTPIKTTLDFESRRGIANLAPATAAGEPVTFEQMNAAIEGLAWKDSARVATQANLNLASPGSTIDGVTMSSGDRVLVRSQTTQAENGIYIWGGASTTMTRALDASTAAELEQAVVTVEEGTSAGATFRQSSVNFTLGSGAVVWTAFGTAAPSASEGAAGILEIATQAETDAGTDDQRAVTPLKLATYAGRLRRATATIGDGSATLYTVTHNFNTRDVQVYAYENSGDRRQIFVEIRHATVNTVDLVFDVAPSSNAIRVVVVG